ncbi:MAG: family 20 glycosylhydrolase [Ruminiclostridium sp.]|nr:family 20 glycosylhydrolase [Ruminiclostridium sp.]
MYIGSLMNKKSDLTGVYSFYRRGTKKPFSPEILNGYLAEASGSCPLYEGILFSGKTFGWKGLSVFDVGVDLVIKFDQECYIDTVSVKLGEGSGIGELLVLAENKSGSEDIIGLREKYTDPMINAEGVSRLSIKRADYIDKSKIVIPVGYSTDNIIVRFKGNICDILIEKFDVTGAIFDSAAVYPVPVRTRQIDGEPLKISGLSKIVISEHTNDDCRFAANLLKEKLYEDFSANIPIVSFKDGMKLDNSLVMGICGDIKAIDKEFSEMPKAEGYNLKTGVRCSYMNAVDRLGLVMAAEALLQLYKAGAGQCVIENYPRMAIRGIHLGLPPREEIPFFKRLVRYLMVPMGYNIVFLEFAGGMRYNRRPEINRAWEKFNQEDTKSGRGYRTGHGDMVAGGSFLEQDEVADLVAYIRSYGMDVIPEVQSLSHVQYITCAYPEVGERDDNSGSESKIDLRTTDAVPREEYANSYCPSNEKSYEIVFDLIDEIVDVVKPRKYVHMGHDEVYTMGVCPKCKGKDHAELYASDVSRIYNYLAGKNLKMMIWSDMLQPSTKYRTPSAAEMIPKDIIMLDFIWYFNFNLDYEDSLLQKGFKVVMGNMYSSHYTRYEQRMAKENMIGAEVSSWCRIDEVTLAEKGKIYDFIYSANMLWSSEYKESLRFVYNKIIAGLIPDMRSKLHGGKYPSINKDARYKPLPLPSPAVRLPYNIMNMLPDNGVHNYLNVPFNFGSIRKVSFYDNDAKPLTIPVNGKFDSLIFLQSASENIQRVANGAKLIEMGYYEVLYSDGTTCKVPVKYGGNIRVWHERYGEPLPHQYYRHEGYIGAFIADAYIEAKAYDGRDVTVYGYEWVNPFKDKEIVSVSCKVTYESDAEIMLFSVTGVY